MGAVVRTNVRFRASALTKRVEGYLPEEFPHFNRADRRELGSTPIDFFFLAKACDSIPAWQ